jgi:tRNA-dihydrouridine synthase
MLDQTGCHGVMVARGCMGYPWIFRELKAAFIGAPAPEAPSLAERHALLNRHIELYLETYGEKLTCLQIRKHLLWYFRATPGEAVLKANLAGLRTAQQVFVVVAQAVEACRRARQPFLFKKGLDRHPNRR